LLTENPWNNTIDDFRFEFQYLKCLFNKQKNGPKKILYVASADIDPFIIFPLSVLLIFSSIFLLLEINYILDNSKQQKTDKLLTWPLYNLDQKVRVVSNFSTSFLFVSSVTFFNFSMYLIFLHLFFSFRILCEFLYLSLFLLSVSSSDLFKLKTFLFLALSYFFLTVILKLTKFKISSNEIFFLI
jgi:hypothetical protein